MLQATMPQPRLQTGWLPGPCVRARISNVRRSYGCGRAKGLNGSEAKPEIEAATALAAPKIAASKRSPTADARRRVGFSASPLLNDDQQLKAHALLQLTIKVFSHTRHVPTYRLNCLGFVLAKCPLRSVLEESFSGTQPDRYSCLCTLFGLQRICEARSIFGFR
jgi:hypothetical protein